MTRTFALLRTLFFATLFVSLWTYFLPRWMGLKLQVVFPIGWILIVIGGLLCGWCVLAFALRGLGTPAPWDPPRRLVVTGLYRFVRNPMYVGMGIVMIGEAILIGRVEMIYLALFALFAVSLFIVLYEEPTLRSKFGEEYLEYCRHVRRWIPRLTPYKAAPSGF